VELRGAARELIAAARDADPDALADLVSALARLGDPGLARELAELADHADPRVRVAVAQALGGLDDSSPATVAALIVLSRDGVDEVRSWATFALAGERLADAPGAPEALAAKLCDPVDEVRVEAVRGLARRGDRRAIGAALDLAPAWAADPVFRDAVDGLRL
jgi:HEAT repeat protein